MSGHTPGPWRIVIDGTCSGAWPFIGPAHLSDEDLQDDSVAELRACFVEREITGTPATYSENRKRFRKTRDHGQVMADARLIAAAPELLAIAERWAAIDGGAWHVQRHANEKAELLADTAAAIARAGGAS